MSSSHSDPMLEDHSDFDRVCSCGGVKFNFIGIQVVTGKTCFWKLYNCMNCHTTLAQRFYYTDPSVLPELTESELIELATKEDMERRGQTPSPK
jgi:hypothetical protein